MKYSEYINWIIQNPENFRFIYSRVLVPGGIWIPRYLILHTCPYTGYTSMVVSFRVKGNDIIDTTTDLCIANCRDILLEKFRELSGETF